jgi:lipid-binding SYLF domain-containing protein
MAVYSISLEQVAKFKPGVQFMYKYLTSVLALLLVALSASPVRADEYDATISIFKNAGASNSFFSSAYGYAVFPTIGKGGFVVGGAYGEGRVYRQGRYVGDATVVQVTAGWQLGGQAYSQIIFFEDQRAFNEFTGGNFEFSAEANAVAITAGASAAASTTGASAGASGTNQNATTVGGYYKGMATFTVAKGGLMYAATLGGQKFTYKPRK